VITDISTTQVATVTGQSELPPSVIVRLVVEAHTAAIYLFFGSAPGTFMVVHVRFISGLGLVFTVSRRARCGVVGGCEPLEVPALNNAQGEQARRLCAARAMLALGASTRRDGPPDQPGSFASGVRPTGTRSPTSQHRTARRNTDLTPTSG
jgi:hypothetical protein